MKNLLIALLLLAGICFSNAQSCYTLPSGLVSWWRGDGNAQDSAQCNNGTLVNGAHYATGLFGQCFEFDGVNDYVEIPHSSNLSFHTNSTMTIEFWVYSTDPRLPAHMLGKRSDCSGPAGFNYQVSPDVFYPYNFPGEWVHFAQVYQQTPYKAILIYVNGYLSDTIVGAGLDSENSSSLRLGTSDNCPSSQSFKGKLDEIRIYNRALSGSEIYSVANNTTAPCGLLTLTIIPAGNNQVWVCWPTRPCRHYQLDYTTSLQVPIQWIALVKNLYSGTPYYCYLDDISGGQRYYRVIELP